MNGLNFHDDMVSKIGNRSDLGRTSTQSYNDWLDKHDTEILVDIIREVSTHLMGIGDNIGSALLKEYANGYKKGEQDGGADAIRNFAKWLQENVIIDAESGVTVVAKVEYTRVISFIELLEMYEKEQRVNEG